MRPLTLVPDLLSQVSVLLSPPQRPLSCCCAALSVKVAVGLGRGKNGSARGIIQKFPIGSLCGGESLHSVKGKWSRGNFKSYSTNCNVQLSFPTGLNYGKVLYKLSREDASISLFVEDQLP